MSIKLYIECVCFVCVFSQGYSPRHLDFEVLNEIQPLFFLFEFPQQISILYEPNQSLMQSKL